MFLPAISFGHTLRGTKNPDTFTQSNAWIVLKLKQLKSVRLLALNINSNFIIVGHILEFILKRGIRVLLSTFAGVWSQQNAVGF